MLATEEFDWREACRELVNLWNKYLETAEEVDYVEFDNYASDIQKRLETE